MEVKILEERENELFNRKEIKFLVKHDGAVKRADVRKELASLFNWNENLVVVLKIEQQFGKKESIGTANLYKSEESLREYEPKYILRRNELIKVEEKKEAQVEAKSSEAG